MVRYRIYNDHGWSHLAPKGETLRDLESWKRAHNKNKGANIPRVIRIEAVKDRIRRRPKPLTWLERETKIGSLW